MTGAVLVEQHVLERLDVVVELLDRGEVPVDDRVHQPVNQSARTEFEQIGVLVPGVQHGRHVELGSTEGDQRCRQDEAGDAFDLQPILGAVPQWPGQLRRVRGEEQMVTVTSHLGTLVGGECVLDLGRRQPQCVDQLGEVGRVRIDEIDPDQPVGLVQRFDDLAAVDGLGDQFAVVPDPAVDLLAVARRHGRQPMTRRDRWSGPRS